MRLITALILCFFIASTCFGEGRISKIAKGQVAPYDGILLDREAESSIDTKRQSVVKVCELEREIDRKEIIAECAFQKSILSLELESEKTRNKAVLQLKDSEVQRLVTLLGNERKEDYTRWWVAGGFLAGVSLSLGIFKIAVEIRK